MIPITIREARTMATLLFATTATAFAQNNPSTGDAASAAKPANPPAAASQPLFAKPAWLTELSLGIRAGYDNNVYRNGADLPAVVPAPWSGSDLALPNKGSFFESVSPKIVVDFAKIGGTNSILRTLALSYAPEFVTYNNAPSESYNAHRVGLNLGATSGDLSLLVDEQFTYNDGNKFGPTFPGSRLSAYGSGITRERREKVGNVANASVKYDQPDWFLRPTLSLLSDNYLAEHSPSPTPAGYQNFGDRSDFNYGADVGYKVTKDFALLAGYRLGEQHQETLHINPQPYTSSSDYQRFLLGFEGKPTKWLTAKLLAGPDLRQYNDKAPVRDSNPNTYYAEGSLSAKVTPDDTITFGYKQWQYVLGSGRSPYFDSNFDLGYKHQFNKQWSANLGARLQSSDYTVGNNPGTADTNPRNDRLYTLSAGVQYAVTANLTLDVAYSYALARNAGDVGAAPLVTRPVSYREFDDQIVSLGAKFKF
ncbi:MAG: outer membrane beta-barrel protein [Kiritimatiellia bacterium]